MVSGGVKAVAPAQWWLQCWLALWLCNENRLSSSAISHNIWRLSAVWRKLAA